MLGSVGWEEGHAERLLSIVWLLWWQKVATCFYGANEEPNALRSLLTREVVLATSSLRFLRVFISTMSFRSVMHMFWMISSLPVNKMDVCDRLIVVLD